MSFSNYLQWYWFVLLQLQLCTALVHSSFKIKNGKGWWKGPKSWVLLLIKENCHLFKFWLCNPASTCARPFQKLTSLLLWTTRCNASFLFCLKNTFQAIFEGLGSPNAQMAMRENYCKWESLSTHSIKDPPIFSRVSKLSEFFLIIFHVLDNFKTIRIFSICRTITTQSSKLNLVPGTQILGSFGPLKKRVNIIICNKWQKWVFCDSVNLTH